MELIIGENTYISLSEFNELIKNYFTESELVQINELSEKDKEVLLYKSCIDMQKLPYRGFKKNKDQKLAFPRMNRFGKESDEDMVKLAQAVNAISFIPSGDSVDQQSYQFVKNGINSFQLGSFKITLNGNKYSGNKLSNGGVVEQLLADWLKGSYRIV